MTAKKCRKVNLTIKEDHSVRLNKSPNKLASLFTQEDIDALKNLIQKSLENAQVINSTNDDLVDNRPPEMGNLSPPVAKHPVLPLDQQKALIQYASKDKLWAILENDNAWYDLLQKGIPKEYLMHFIKRMEELAIKDPKIVAEMAAMFVKNKVKLEDLQSSISTYWFPEDLEEATQYLHTNGFVQSPRVPVNFRA